MTDTGTPRVYVGTYAKYNAGSIAGAWLNLEDYADHDDFTAACYRLHADEDDPELMFQDFEGFPREFYNESSIDPDLWEWIDLDDHDKALLAVYRDHVDESGTLETARDAYCGHGYDTPGDYAYQLAEDCGDLPKHWSSYIDWDVVARELGYDGYTFARVNGEIWVFAPC